MEPELTPELIDQIIFGMENQSENTLFDTHTGELVPEKEADGEPDRYARIPEWGSLHGYQLMERFVRSLRNPIVRESLREALSRGTGVFRNFKNVLRERRDIERLWFSFKEREMRAVVVDWYNRLCDAKGFEKLEFEPDDDTMVEELVLSDFEVTESGPADEEIVRSMDRKAFSEAFEGLHPRYIEERYADLRKGKTPINSESSFVYQAETPDEEIVGVIWGDDMCFEEVDSEEAEGAEYAIYSTILQLYISEAYRGLGLAKMLIKKYLYEAANRNVSKTFIEVPSRVAGLQDYLITNGFSVVTEKLAMDMAVWHDEGF